MIRDLLSQHCLLMFEEFENKNGDNRGLKKMRRVFRWKLWSFLIYFRLFMAIVCKTVLSLPLSLFGIFKVLCIKDDNLVKWFTVTTYLWSNQCSVISCPCKHCLVTYSVSKMNLCNDNSKTYRRPCLCPVDVYSQIVLVVTISCTQPLVPLLKARVIRESFWCVRATVNCEWNSDNLLTYVSVTWLHCYLQVWCKFFAFVLTLIYSTRFYLLQLSLLIRLR